MQIQITPQVFFDLFILCLSWQWDEKSMRYMFTTVDKVVRILSGLGILTDRQRKVLYKDRRTQVLFLKNCGFVSSIDEAGDGRKRQVVLSSREPLVISHDPTRDFSYKRMLRDYRIFLSRSGKAYADSIEHKYSSIVTHYLYQAECDTQEESIKNSKVKAKLIFNYRVRVAEETSSN